jgi:hypothetical protein
MGAGMADALQVGHFGAVIQRFTLGCFGGRRRRLGGGLIFVRHNKWI